MKLTSSQIRSFEEITFDVRGAEETLKIVLTYHANRMNELRRAERELWEELADVHGFDLGRAGGWELSKLEGAVIIVAREPQE